MKKITIAGSNSYIGTSIEKYISRWPQDYQVDTIDMVDGSWRLKTFAGYDSLFYVAGIAHISTKKLNMLQLDSYWTVNAKMPVDAAEKARASGVDQFIFMSSMSVYGENGSIKHPVTITRETLPNPKDIYGRSKLSAEGGLLKYASDSFMLCILRPPMIYGPGCKGNYALLEKAALSLPVFPDIRNERSMLNIENLCVYVKNIIDHKFCGICFPQNSEYVCTSQMVADIAQKHGKKIRMTKFFNPVLHLLSGKVGIVDKVFGGLTYAITNGAIDNNIRGSRA